MTERTKMNSDSFAQKNDLPPYDYVLHPRTTGFVHMVNTLRQCKYCWWCIYVQNISSTKWCSFSVSFQSRDVIIPNIISTEYFSVIIYVINIQIGGNQHRFNFSFIYDSIQSSLTLTNVIAIKIISVN